MTINKELLIKELKSLRIGDPRRKQVVKELSKIDAYDLTMKWQYKQKQYTPGRSRSASWGVFKQD